MVLFRKRSSKRRVLRNLFNLGFKNYVVFIFQNPEKLIVYNDTSSQLRKLKNIVPFSSSLSYPSPIK